MMIGFGGGVTGTTATAGATAIGGAGAEAVADGGVIPGIPAIGAAGRGVDKVTWLVARLLGPVTSAGCARIDAADASINAIVGRMQ